MEIITSVIIDDEEKSRQTLRQMLKIFCPEIQILGEAKDVQTGLELLAIVKPDVVFLDIQMPDGTGFDLLKKIEKKNFHVIFTTAYDQYALRAIKFSALDYLLKPIDSEELKLAVSKVEARSNYSNEKVDNLVKNINQKNEEHKIVLSTSEGMHIVNVKNIIRCQADDYYTNFYLNDGRRIMISKTLKENEELLCEHNFIRTHRSHLVNMAFIKKYVKSDGGYIVLSEGTKIPVSRRKKETILGYLQQF